MSKIESMCEIITAKMEKELNLDANQKAVIQYGLFAMIHTTLAIVLSVILGILFGVLIPTLIICIAVIVLRKYSGGAHASNPEECMLIGILVAVGGSLILTQVDWQISNILIIGITTFLWAFYKVHQLVPVDSKAKPIKTKEKRLMLKKKSYFVLIIYIIIVIGILIRYLQIENQKYLIYIASIYGGVIWEIFTLTMLGHLLIQKIDMLFNKLTHYKGGK